MTNLTEAVEGSSLTALNKGELFSSFDVDAFEVPHGRDEIWRFTPLRRLRGLHDGSAHATGKAQITVTEQPGVRTEVVRRGDERLGQGGVPADRVAAQAFSSFNSATVVTVARDTEVAKPIEIVVDGPGEGAVAYGHLQIRVEELARAIVVVDLRGSGTYADNVEIIVSDSAALGVIWIADWADDMVNVSAHHARLGKDSVLGHVNVTLGETWCAPRRRCGSPPPAATLNCSAPTSPMTASTSNPGCSSTTLTPIAARTCCTRVRCKRIRNPTVRTHTPSGSATC